MFDDQPPYNYTDRHILTRLLAFSNELTVGRDAIDQSVDDAKVKGLQQLKQPPSQVMGMKRKYKCKVYKGEEHGKRMCKIIKPTLSVGPVNKNIWVRVL